MRKFPVKAVLMIVAIGGIFPLFQNMSSVSTVDAQPAACFSRDDSLDPRMKFRVIQTATPPKYNSATKNYSENNFYPATDFSIGQAALMNELSPKSVNGLEFGKFYTLWANRCVFMPGVTPSSEQCRNTKKPKGNYYAKILKNNSDAEVRPMFSTYTRANLCTYMQAQAVLGNSLEKILTNANRFGLRGFIRASDGSTDAALLKLTKNVRLSDGEVRPYFADVCILEDQKIAADADGIILDYEVWDWRTQPEALAFLQKLADRVHGHNKKLIVFSDSIAAAATQNAIGIGADNVADILRATDGFSPVIWSGATPGDISRELNPSPRQYSFETNYDRQLSVLKASVNGPLSASLRAKFIPTISLYDLRLPDAEFLRSEILNQNYLGVRLWRNGSSQGGACGLPLNQSLACLTLGVCNGNYH